MTTIGNFIGWVLVLLIAALIVWPMYDGYNPDNRIRKRIDIISNSPVIRTLRNLIQRIYKVADMIFGLLIILSLAYVGGNWYVNESDWYSREREVEVFFNAHQWIEGEIHTCYSTHATTLKDTDTEIKAISCSLEKNESHVLNVKFRGPITADKDRVWRCQRSQAAITCGLQSCRLGQDPTSC